MSAHRLNSTLLSNHPLWIKDYTSVVTLRRAARVVEQFLITIEKVRPNSYKEELQLIVDGVSKLIVSVWHQQEKVGEPMSLPAIEDLVQNLTKILIETTKTAERQAKAKVLLLNYGGPHEIRHIWEQIIAAVARFQRFCHMRAVDLFPEMITLEQSLAEIHTDSRAVGTRISYQIKIHDLLGLKFKKQMQSVQMGNRNEAGNIKEEYNSNHLVQCVGALHHSVMLLLPRIKRVQGKICKDDLLSIADDIVEVAATIMSVQERAGDLNWLFPEIKDMVGGLIIIIEALVEVRKLDNAGKIRQTRHKIDMAVARFEALSCLKINSLLLEVTDILGQQEVSEQGQNGKEVEDTEGEGEEEEEEEDPDPAAHCGPTPTASPNQTGPSFVNNGSGIMNNQNVGNVNSSVHVVNHIYLLLVPVFPP